MSDLGTLDIGGKRVQTLTINGKTVSKLLVDGKLAYSAMPDFRHLVNEETYDILSSDTVAETLTYSGKSYNIYQSLNYQNTWTDKGTGKNRPWFVSPKIMMYAHHWGTAPQYNFDIEVDGQTVNIQSIAEGAQVNLKEWCLANGWTEDELPGPAGTTTGAYSDFRFEDIDMIVCQTPSVDISSICPYFMSEITMKKIFYYGRLEGTVGWRQSQSTNELIPVYFGYNDFYCALSYPYAKANDIKEENLKSLSAITDQQYPIYTGDSGKPHFLYYKGKNIVVSQNYSASQGPKLIEAFPYIKAFVEAHGDTLKEFTPEMIETE